MRFNGPCAPAAPQTALSDESEYDRYERLYGEADRPERSPRPKPPPLSMPADSDAGEDEADLPMTYRPGRFERGWLASSLRPFYEQCLITDVLAHVKGGKEASVYCCRAAPDLGLPLLAAKVYRPRQFRNLRNDKMYREGRPILKADGKPVKKTDHRLMRAVGKKTAFGVQVEHTSWLMHEFTTLESLFRAGGAVPQPVASSDNALLMAYCGDESRPAPALSQVRLEPEEAAPLFAEVARNIRLMWTMGLVHGDLSAYNLLYWEGKVTLIDFPQVTSMEGNGSAGFILERDITRVCEYFALQGVDCDPAALIEELRLEER